MPVRTSRSSPFRLVIAFSLLACSLAVWPQGAPKKNSVIGIAIGATPQAVEARLSELYPACEIDSRQYLNHDPYGSHPGFSRVGEYLVTNEDDCSTAQRRSGKLDYVQVDYVHASQDSRSPAYEIKLYRTYEEPATLRPAGVTLDELMETLTAEYGAPLATTLKVDDDLVRLKRSLRSKSVSPTPYVSEVKWYSALPKKSIYCLADECGPLTLEAKIESEGPPGKNARLMRVKRVVLTMTDHVLYYKHLDWTIEFEAFKKKALKSF